MGNVTTEAARERFLAGLAAGMRVSTAAAVAGLSRSRAYELKKNDADFAASWEAACAQARPAVETPPPFDPRQARDGRLALLLNCLPPRQAPPDPRAAPDMAGSPRRETTAAAKAAFLGGIGAGLTVSQAARRAGLARAWAYTLSRRDPEFADAWRKIAVSVGADAQMEARRRVFGGAGIPPRDGQAPPDGRFDAAADRLLIALIKRSNRRLAARRDVALLRLQRAA